MKSSQKSVRGFIVTLLLLLMMLGMLCAVGVGIYALSLDGTVRQKFEGKRWAIPAKVYSRPLELYSGAAISKSDVLAELALLHYRRQDNYEGAGIYSEKNGELFVHTRGFVFSDGTERSQVLKLQFEGNTLTDVASTEVNNSGIVRLEPLIIGGIYPKQNEDRVLMQLKEAPKYLEQALLSTEDKDFYHHFGVSIRGTLRAIFVNLSRGELRQGGSTLTQQLVKNFYLTDERSLKRKINEALMALLLEWHYSKQEILETYLNEVNIGQNGNRSINGFGLAAQFYFGQPISELSLHQVALLVGLVKGPSYYNPWRNSQRSLERRNVVLTNLFKDGHITQSQLDKAKAKPLSILKNPTSGLSMYPAFLDVVRRQLKQEYQENDLNSTGLRIFTTLDPRVQQAAEQAFDKQVQRLRHSGNKRISQLQGSVVVANPESGELLAVVGGYGTFTGFNRAVDASRQVGSLLKPVVYLTALETAKFNLVTPLDDAAVQVQSQSGDIWTPENYDHQSHGMVPLYDALAHSYNQATIRLGMSEQVGGVNAVINTLKQLGVTQDLPNYPSILLGTINLSPMEVLHLYQPFASGGFQTSPRSIREVVDAQSKRLTRYGLEVKQVYDPAALYLINYAMQQTMRYGTGASAYKTLPDDLIMAGKTGTTNDGRDAWFAGYTGNYLAVVWLGNDDNKATGLSGGSGALPIWTDMMAHIKPTSLNTVLPDKVQWQWLEKSTGKLSSEACSDTVLVPVLAESVTETSDCVINKAQVNDPINAILNNSINKILDIFR